MQNLGGEDGDRLRPRREEQRAGRDGDAACRDDEALAPHGVHQRAGGQLAHHRDRRAQAQRLADMNLRPRLGREVNSDERPEPGLRTRDEAVQEVQPKTAAGRSHLGVTACWGAAAWGVATTTGPLPDGLYSGIALT